MRRRPSVGGRVLCSPSGPADVSMITVRPAKRRFCRIVLDQREAIHLGHQRIDDRPARTGRRPRRHQRARRARRRRSATDVPRSRQASSISSRMRRFVALSSTTSTRRSCRPTRPAGASAGAATSCALQRNGEVEGAALCRPRCRSRCGRPSARRVATRSPAPARCRRSAASSIRRPARRRRRSATACSDGMPMPVSLNDEVHAHVVAACRSPDFGA